MRVVHPVEQTIFDVPVLIGAAEELVQLREQCGKYTCNTGFIKRQQYSVKYNKSRTKDGYQTNPAIRYWSTWFMLKAITESGLIKNWINQKEFLLSFCKITETTFRSHLKELMRLNLLNISSDYSINLTSYEKAADILGVHYTGTYTIKYDIRDENKQSFQYLLRAEEMRNNQQKQLDALIFKADKNPVLKEWLMPIFARDGYSEVQLKNDPKLFQVLLFKLQQQAFVHGSEIYKEIHALRADVNRGVSKIKDDHNYVSAQSASYLKSVMIKQGIIEVEQKFLVSHHRCRLYVPKAEGEQYGKEAYKYLPHQKKTGWRLTDQVKILSKSTNEKERNARKNRAA